MADSKTNIAGNEQAPSGASAVKKAPKLSAEDQAILDNLIKDIKIRLDIKSVTATLDDATKKAALTNLEQWSKLSSENKLNRDQQFAFDILRADLAYLSKFNVWPELNVKLGQQAPTPSTPSKSVDPAAPKTPETPPPAATSTTTTKPPETHTTTSEQKSTEAKFHPLSFVRADYMRGVFNSAPESIMPLLNYMLKAYSGFGIDQFLPDYKKIPDDTLEVAMTKALSDPKITEEGLAAKFSQITQIPFQKSEQRKQYDDQVALLLKAAYAESKNSTPAAAAKTFATNFTTQMTALRGKAAPELNETPAKTYLDYTINPSLLHSGLSLDVVNAASAAYKEHNKDNRWPGQKSFKFTDDATQKHYVSLVEAESNIFTMREVTPTLKKFLDNVGFKDYDGPLGPDSAYAGGFNSGLVTKLLKMPEDEIQKNIAEWLKSDALKGETPESLRQALDTYRLLQNNLNPSELTYGLPNGAADKTGRYYVESVLNAPNLQTVAAQQAADREAQKQREAARQAEPPKPVETTQTPFQKRYEERMAEERRVEAGATLVQNANGKVIAAVKPGTSGYDDKPCPPKRASHHFNWRAILPIPIAITGDGVKKKKLCCPDSGYCGHDPHTGQPVANAPAAPIAAPKKELTPGCAPDNDCVVHINPDALKNVNGAAPPVEPVLKKDAAPPADKNCGDDPCIVRIRDNMVSMNGVPQTPATDAYQRGPVLINRTGASIN